MTTNSDISSRAETLPVCIIGAGSSGVTAAKALKEKGVNFDCYELGSNIGGMWRYENDNGLSSAYRSLHIDTSRNNLGYSDFPIPNHYPDFLSHFQVIEYLESYAKKFGVENLIQFNSRVINVEPANDGNWMVTLKDGRKKLYRAVVVANGHLWDPRWADFKGTFDGKMMHSHHYRTADQFEGKHVLIVGIGNSAVDVAVDVCKSARSTTISTRRSAWIMPKYIMGYPTDQWSSFFAKRLHLSTRFSRTLVRWLARLTSGDQARFGIAHPTHAVWREHATVSQELLSYCGHGWIKIKPNIDRLEGHAVFYDDGSSQPIDVIIHATGYKPSFPFLSKDVFAVGDGKVELYRRILPVTRPGLYLLGLVQPVGPTLPLVEIQARWLASVLANEVSLPAFPAMQEEVNKHNEHIAKQYVGSARYTLEVDFRTYAKQLAGDMNRKQAGN
jgi:dimethylaniline monooxygenase (N-oxide forming)